MAEEGTSGTRKLLLEALPETDFEGLLLALARLDGAAREALKGKDRERAWEKIPPTERQLAFLRELGHKGPPPKTLKEASDLIEALLERKRG